MKAGRTQAERRANAETSIIQSAIELISAEGLDKLTLTKVAERSGYSRYIPVHYYGRKSNLVAATAENLIAPFVSCRRKLQNLERGLPRIASLVESYIGELGECPTRSSATHIFVAAALTNSAVKEIIGPHTQDSISYISEEIAEGIKMGNVRADVDPVCSAVILLGFLRGINPLTLIHEDIDLDDTKKEILTWIDAYLSSRS